MALQAVHDPTECGICKEDFDDQERCPRILHCSHYICSLCIEMLIVNDMRACPFCRQEFTATSATDIMKNHAVLEFMEYMTLKESMRKRPHHKRVSNTENVIERKKETEEIANDLFHILQNAKRQLRKSMYDTEELEESCKLSNSNLEDDILLKIRNVIKKNIKKSAELEMRKGKLRDQLQELEGKEDQLQDEKGKLNSASIPKDMAAAVHDLEETNCAISGWVDRLMELNAETKNTLQREKQDEKSTKELISALTKELNSHLERDANPPPVLAAQQVLGRLTASELRNMSEPVKQLVEQGKVYAVRRFDGIRRSAKISFSGNRLFLHHLKQQAPPDNVNVVKFDDVLRLQDPSSRLAFLELSAGGSTLGMMHLRLYPNTPATKQFMLLCTGETSHCYANTRLLYMVGKDDRQLVICGDYESDSGAGGKTLVPGIVAGNQYCQPEAKGIVKGLWWDPSKSERGAQFAIYTKGNPQRMLNTAFGEVVDGLDVLIEAISCHSDVRRITISDCGLIL